MLGIMNCETKFLEDAVRMYFHVLSPEFVFGRIVFRGSYKYTPPPPPAVTLSLW